MERPSRAAGDQVGRYRLIEKIGQGGFGDVWKSHDEMLDRIVAIKFARADVGVSQSVRRRIRDEARKAGKLTHPGIIPVFDVQDGENGFIVAEFIDGPTLKQRMAEGPIDARSAVNIVIQVADALHCAHDLIHRDVKPANILIRPNGEPALTDFGLAISELELLDESAGVVGTRSYMSPEQARGEYQSIDARTDVYGLGVILYELLTGRLPFVARSFQEYLDQVGSRNPRPLRTLNSAIDPQLERICLKCLERSTSDRYTTCGEIADDLRAFQTETKATARKTKRGWLLGGALAAVCAAVAIVAFTIGGNRPESNANAVADKKTETNSKPGTRKPDSEGWIHLLGQEPKVPPWKDDEGRGQPQFDASQRRYAVQSESDAWVVSAWEIDSQPYELRSIVAIDGWLGNAGIVFGLHRNPQELVKEEYHGLVVDVYRLNPKLPPSLRLRHLEFERGSFGHLTIKGLRLIARQTIPVPAAQDAELRVSVKKTGIVVYWKESGKTIEWRPEDLLNIVEWLPDCRTEVGMTGRGRDVVFRAFLLRQTLIKDKKKR